jgi:hypothetical protein
MTVEETKKLIIPILFAATFGWTIYYILSYDEFYKGEELARLRISVNNKPQYYFDGNTKNSFYSITAQKYINDFRISMGALEIITKNDTFRNQLEEIKSGDTITLEIRNSDLKLLNKLENIRIIGLATVRSELINPFEVKKIEKINKKENMFFNYLILFGLVFFITRTLIKSKTQK